MESLVDIPEEFVCPITQQMMNDPVIAADGHSYEKEAIYSWFSSGRKRSPTTNEALLHKTLTENISLRKLINSFKQSLPAKQREKQVKVDLETAIKKREEMIQSRMQRYQDINLFYNEQKNEPTFNLDAENPKLLKLLNDVEKMKKDFIEINALKAENSQIKAELKEIKDLFFNLIPNVKLSNNNYGDPVKQNNDNLSIQSEKLNDYKHIYRSNFEQRRNNINNSPDQINRFNKPNFRSEISKVGEGNKKMHRDLNAFKQTQNQNNSINSKCPLNNIEYLKAQEVQTLSGHTNSVYFLLKVSENLFASGSWDCTIKLWREEDGKFKVIQTLIGHTFSVSSLLKLSENVLVSGSYDGTIKLWREENGKFKEIQTLTGHTFDVLSLLKVSETVIASGSYEIKLWRQENGKFNQIQTLTGHTSGVRCLLKVSENLLASGAEDNTIKLWKEENGKFKEIQTLTEHTSTVSSLLKVSENVIASGSKDKNIKLWKEENGRFIEIQTLTGHNSNVSSLVKLSENVIASGSYDKTIKFWREDNGKFQEIQTLTAHPEGVLSLLKVSDNLLASGAEDYTIKLWRLGEK